MKYAKPWLAAALLLAHSIGGAADGRAASATVAFFSESALTGMKLAAAKAHASGQINDQSFNCVKKLKPNVFHAVMQTALERELNAEERKAAEEYYGSPTGKKTMQVVVAQMHKEYGETPPGPMPKVTEQDSKAMQKFLSTSANKKLNEERVMNKPGATELIYSRMNELSKQCTKS